MRFTAAARRLGVLFAVFAALLLGLSAPALAAATPTNNLTYGQVLTEEDGDDGDDASDDEESDNGDGGGKHKGTSTKKKAITGGIGATTLVVIGFIVRQIRRAYKVYKFGRSAYKTGKFAHRVWRRQ